MQEDMDDNQDNYDDQISDDEERDMVAAFYKNQSKDVENPQKVNNNKYIERQQLPYKKVHTEEYKPCNVHYVGPVRPPSDHIASEDSDDDSSQNGLSSDRSEPEVEPDWAELGIPVTHEAVLKGHTKYVSDITFDRTSTRMVSGGLDYKILFWDFPNMTQNYRYFRQLQPIEGQPITICKFDSKGTKILVSARSPKPRLLNRDGKEIIEFLRGDMYISDPCFSRGHIAEVTTGDWHTVEENLVITAS